MIVMIMLFTDYVELPLVTPRLHSQADLPDGLSAMVLLTVPFHTSARFHVPRLSLSFSCGEVLS